MDFSLSDEQKMVQQTVRSFVNRELVPLEGQVLLVTGSHVEALDVLVNWQA